MKVIDLLNKIANGEEVPKKIKFRYVLWIYNEENQDYLEYNKDDSDLFGYAFCNLRTLDFINDEVEILDEEFEDIKPLEQIVMKKVFYKDANDLAKDVSISFEKIDDIVISINDLVKNQNKIIEKLNKNNNIQ